MRFFTAMPMNYPKNRYTSLCFYTKQEIICQPHLFFVILRPNDIISNMNKNNRKEHLYAIAFKLFLTKRYDAVSISDIEKESGMTRGAITYYGKDKRGLFYAVIHHYLIDSQNLDFKLHKKEFESLSDFIDEYVKCSQETITRFRQIDSSVENGSRAYMALILQICDFFPDLHEQYLENRNKEMLKWIEIIQMAITNQEIRDNIDVITTAKMFMNVFYGQSYLDALSAGLNISELRLQFKNIYRLIKI